MGAGVWVCDEWECGRAPAILLLSPCLPHGRSKVPKNILIIDDSAVFRRLLRSHLEDRGHLVFEAEDGQEAISHLNLCVPAVANTVTGPNTPDLIVLDVLMPIMDGYTFIQRLRRQLPEHVRGTPVICLTSRSKMRDLFEMEGVQGFVEKTPEGLEELVSLVDDM